MIKALILNDTSPGGHPGCLLVMKQLADVCSASGIVITRTLSLGRHLYSLLQNELKKCDVVIINGEGTMHHDSPGSLMLCNAGRHAREAGKPVVLINTVWEKNKLANAILPACSLVAARESLSAREIAEQGVNPRLVPDLVFSCSHEALFVDAHSSGGNLVVMDDVRHETAKILAKYALFKGAPFIRMAPRPSLRSPKSIANWCQIFILGRCRSQFRLDQTNIIKNATVLVTGRFHGACLAIMAGRPFIALSSNTHKIEGLLADANLGQAALLLDDNDVSKNPLKTLDHAVDRLRDAINDITLLHDYQSRCNSYITKARRDIALMFKDINKIGQRGSR